MTTEVLVTVLGTLLPSVVTGIVSITVCCITNIKLNKANQKKLEDGVKSLLKDSMTRLFRYYKQENGLTYQELENFNDMYEDYHALGGNGSMTTLHNILNNDPKIKLSNNKSLQQKTNEGA